MTHRAGVHGERIIDKRLKTAWFWREKLVEFDAAQQVADYAVEVQVSLHHRWPRDPLLGLATSDSCDREQLADFIE